METHFLQQILSIQNDTVRHLLDDSVSNISLALNLIKDLNTTIYRSFLFDFIEAYRTDYLEDFTSRLSYD